MKPVHLCVTVRNRYDMIRAMLLSALAGSRPPDGIYVIDNGNRPDLLLPQLEGLPATVVPLTEEGQVGASLAKSLNWFLTELSEERVITHDDLTFSHHSIQTLIDTPGEFILDEALGVLLIRDACVAAVGLHDETISPGFYRFEDCDFQHRMALKGLYPVLTEAGIIHTPNGTMRGYSEADLADYYRRTEIAEQNYIRKWGEPPQRGRNNLWV